MSDPATTLQQLLQQAAVSGTLQTAVFSRPRASGSTETRVDVRPVLMRSGLRFQFSTQAGAQQLHRNLPAEAAAAELWRLASEVYRDVRLVTATGVWEARFSKKNACFLQQQTPAQSGVPADAAVTDTAAAAAVALPTRAAGHNRERDYLIPDGQPCPFLIQTGVMTASGQVRARQYHKFRQINRYLEFVHAAVQRLPGEQPLQIVDFGCGKSYLTFATHYLLTQILQRPCHITGLDRRSDVVDTCRQIAEALQLQDIEFRIGQIADYQPPAGVDLAISLHACDTATDDALHQAIRWGSRIILAVPCCQHELASRIQVAAMPVMLQHGILKERFSALATDAVRAAVLNAVGYDAQVMEFIDLEHTAKNLLIRAVRSETPPELSATATGTPAAEHAGNPSGSLPLTGRRLQHWQQLQDFRRQLAIPPLRLEYLLQRSGLLPEAGLLSRPDVLPETQ